MGGSAGAKVFNDFVSQNQATLTERYNVINLTGDASFDVLSNRLFAEPM